MNGFFGMDITMDFAWTLQLGYRESLCIVSFRTLRGSGFVISNLDCRRSLCLTEIDLFFCSADRKTYSASEEERREETSEKRTRC